MLLDTASLYFRAFFGVPDTVRRPTARRSTPCAGCSTSSAGWSTTTSPTHLACCWDNDWRPQWRVDLLPTYKAHRVVAERPATTPDVEEVPDPLEQQIPIIEAVLEAFGIAIVGADHYEADDVIGTLATGAGMPVDIVTGDRDLFQLVDDERRGPRALHRARRGQARAGRQRLGARAATASTRTSTPPSPPCAATPPTACPAWPASATRPRPCC